MLFKNTYKRHQRKNNIVNMFSSAYEVNKNYKIEKYILDLYFPLFRVAVIFGEYDKEDEKIKKLQEVGIVFLNILESENIFSACGRLLYFLKTQEYKMLEKIQEINNGKNTEDCTDIKKEEDVKNNVENVNISD